MNPHKTEEDLFHHHDLDPTNLLSQPPHPSIHHHHEEDPTFSLPEFVLFRSSPSLDSPSHSSDEQDSLSHPTPETPKIPNPRISISTQEPRDWDYINPDPHISSQFYTFNSDSHSLMILCLREGRLASPAEIRVATPRSVLKSWRSVWKDRNEDTAYVTAWKRIQDKLTARLDPASGNEFLCFKNNTRQFVSHVSQWQDIVMGFHGDGDLKHLGVRETIDRIKQVWTVGAKLYGIPESFIRVCVAACGVCNAVTGSGSRNKRRRFEYTESFDVPAKDVADRLQELAAKHKVVLCIRQKYIRYKPFMAEVKDYACHRAGEPASKKSRVLKREPYQSKRCGCGFRIRAIVPIANYNEKDKTFVYEEEGTAVFKMYAVHSGHEPGAMDGNARIMHRLVGHKGFLMEHDVVYGVREELESEEIGKDDGGDMRLSVLHQVHELRSELGTLEGKIGKIPEEMLGSVSRELFEMLNKIRNIDEEGVKGTTGLLSDKEMLVGDNDLAHWSDHHHHHEMYGDGKDTELIEDDEDSFGRSLDDVVPWEQIRPPSGCTSPKDILSETSCKPEKWLKCNDFDEKSILNCEDSKLTKPMRGTPEGVIAAAALKCMGGSMQGRLWPRNEDEAKRALEANYDIKKILRTEDLCKGEDVFFAATGVSDGDMLRGVRYCSGGASTNSIVMRHKSGTVRFVETYHKWAKPSVTNTGLEELGHMNPAKSSLDLSETLHNISFSSKSHPPPREDTSDRLPNFANSGNGWQS